jgi:hypothetical protein
MPHMAFGSHHNNTTNGSGNERKLKIELYRVLEALRDKMGKMDLERNNDDGATNDDTTTTTTTTSSKSIGGVGGDNSTNQKPATTNTNNLKSPLVVVPELPVAPLRLFRLVPLCWFLVPIFRAMEENKKFLATCFPDYVVFVEQPDLQWWTDTEVGIGPVRENIEREQLLLRVTDIAHNAREKVQQLMKKYNEDKEGKAGKSEQASTLQQQQQQVDAAPVSAMEGEDNIRMMDDHDHLPFDDEKAVNKNETTLLSVGSSLVSVDNVHPNDEGYELWGRYIAAAIIKHWNRE